MRFYSVFSVLLLLPAQSGAIPITTDQISKEETFYDSKGNLVVISNEDWSSLFEDISLIVNEVKPHQVDTSSCLPTNKEEYDQAEFSSILNHKNDETVENISFMDNDEESNNEETMSKRKASIFPEFYGNIRRARVGERLSEKPLNLLVTGQFMNGDSNIMKLSTHHYAGKQEKKSLSMKKCAQNLLLLKNSNVQEQTEWHLIFHEKSLENLCSKSYDPNTINQKDDDGNTPMHIAVKNRREDIVKLLMKNDADVNLFDNNNLTPLMLAIETCNLRMTKLLLDNKSVDVNLSKSDGERALSLAVRKKNIGILKKLIGRKAEINFCNKVGETPYTISKTINAPDISALLIQKGAFINPSSINFIKNADEDRSTMETI